MKTQIIEQVGKKAFAVIPYKDFLRMQEALEDYHALKALRRAKVDKGNQSGRPFEDAAWELGLLKKRPARRWLGRGVEVTRRAWSIIP